MAGGYEISLSGSDANPATQSSPINLVAGGGTKPYVVLIIAALVLVGIVVWKRRN